MVPEDDPDVAQLPNEALEFGPAHGPQGHGEPPAPRDVGPPRAPIVPPSRYTSILPAMAVVVIAIVVLGIFAAVDVATSQTATPTTLPLVVDHGLRPDTHSAVFRGDVEDDEPPPNIASALLVPLGAQRVARLGTGGNTGGDYDVEVRIAAHAPRSELLGFYEANLRALGWALYSNGTGSGNSDELLFDKAGTDGNYWEAGVIADPTVAGTTRYDFRLFVVDSDM